VNEEGAKPPAPILSDRQRREALALANQVRIERSRVKQELKRGDVYPASLVAECPPYLQTAKVYDLLRAVPRYGPAKANKLLDACRISPTKTLAGLTARQRRELIQALEH
jgi:hypothetical protein